MSNKTYDAIAIGACNLDEVSFVPKFAEAEEKINASSYYPPHAAGVAMDCISQMNQLGCKTGWFGIKGDDTPGADAIKELIEDGIDVSRAITARGERTSKAWISVNDQTGERCHIIIPMGKAGFITAEQVIQNRDYLENTALIHLELLQMPIDGMLEAAKIVKKAGGIVSFDIDVAPDYAYHSNYATPESLNELIKNTTVLKACKNAVLNYCGHENYSEAAVELLERGPEVVIITLGENGCVIASNKDGKIEKCLVKGFSGYDDLKIIDTTGAGDAFQGGFLYGYLKGWPLEKCGKIANAAGYLKSTRIGARNSVPHRLLQDFLEQNCSIKL